MTIQIFAFHPVVSSWRELNSFTKTQSMAKHQSSLELPFFLLLLPFLFLYTITTMVNGRSQVSARSIQMYPKECYQPSPKATCSAYLYHISQDLTIPEIGSHYSANASLIKPITRMGKEDYLVWVPCNCEAIVNLTTAYFHDTQYSVKLGDTPDGISSNVFSGQAYGIEEENFTASAEILIHLPCACLPTGLMAVTYTVQSGDTLTAIADLLWTDVGSIQRMNEKLTSNPDLVYPGLVLFVPMGAAAPPLPSRKAAKKSKTALILGISIPAAFIIAASMILIFLWRARSHKLNVQDPRKKVDGCMSTKSISALERQYTDRENIGDIQPFESERPVTFSLGELEEATIDFDETRKLGEGGYGSVYYGIILGNQEVAIKKMKSSKSKEFFAELKALCKVHHINVVELIGYASGDDHLYLVYEYVQNGSLNEHLHDPLLEGRQPLSWNARAQIALDAARGIEYIHDHTKARYVHRDIKTSNILLDNGLRAKVADFGLVKLVERSGEEECLATRLVGTPGYLPPESVRELQMTTKTDVFAFGVVLAELITGYCALMRDNKEPKKMKSLISIMKKVFQEEDPQTALEAIIDGNLKDKYPIEEIFKMAEISAWCLNDDPINRPEMRDITMKLSQILMASTEWEASLGGDSQVFSGVFDGR